MAQLDRSVYSGLFIGGEWRAPKNSTTTTVINPATGASVAEAPFGCDADADAAIGVAREAFDRGPWPRMSGPERARHLRRLLSVLRDWADDIGDLAVAEVGMPVSIARATQVEVPLQQLEYFIGLAEAFDPLTPLPTTLFPNRSGGRILGAGVVQRQPRGVVGAITPFNAPFFLNVMKVAPALAAGCTVVLKPSEFTPLEALVLAAAAQAAELPPGILNVVPGGRDVGERLTTDPRVDMVTFTGSDAVGSVVMAQAAGTVKHVLLELGGKSAMIVRADADLEAVARRGAVELTLFSGQGCGLWTRHLIHRSLHDEYVERLCAAIAGIPIGDPSDPATIVGPLIRPAQVERAERYVAQAVREGATIAAGGRRPDGFDRGFWYAPTVLTEVRNEMDVAQDEIFGPVGVVIPFDTDDDAIRIANDSRYGLSGSVWSADPAEAFRIARELRTGNVSINGGTGGMNPAAPFGGYKRSGLGRELGAEALFEYCETKTIQFHAG
ncbi:aldehyde dehydrogenase family protein [Nocardia harenae]|uniref:aldehyde dehydrogenase family protein n=1 Tax=Nocardia harenae TaxID=358707 RepID=UPI000A8E4508|nr:aldehyde dehydrogenase family protein [Nocardia harenae]